MKSGAGLRQNFYLENSGVRAVSAKYCVVGGTGPGHYLLTKIIKK